MSEDLIKGLQAQLDATKQMFNEVSNSNLQLRTQIILMQNIMNDQANQIKTKDQKITELSQPLLQGEETAVNQVSE